MYNVILLGSFFPLSSFVIWGICVSISKGSRKSKDGSPVWRATSNFKQRNNTERKKVNHVSGFRQIHTVKKAKKQNKGNTSQVVEGSLPFKRKACRISQGENDEDSFVKFLPVISDYYFLQNKRKKNQRWLGNDLKIHILPYFFTLL